MSVPVIDVSPLAGSDPARRAETVASLGDACRTVGFFAVIGHGIPQHCLDAAFEASRRLFALPEPAKLALRGGDMASTNRGYVPLRGERLSADMPPDVKEAFNIGPELAPEIAGAPDVHPGTAANLWPDLPAWRSVMLDYLARCHALGRSLHRAFAEILGVEADFFEASLKAPGSVLRLLHYPGCADGGGTAGAGEHTDYGNVTILAIDGVAGLQVRDRAGRWIDVSGLEGGFVCNIGDCLMRWSNDIYVSTPHRVMNPPGRDRYSVAFFLDPNPDVLIDCLPGCHDAGRPKYPPILAADYLRQRLDATYQK